MADSDILALLNATYVWLNTAYSTYIHYVWFETTYTTWLFLPKKKNIFYTFLSVISYSPFIWVFRNTYRITISSNISWQSQNLFNQSSSLNSREMATFKFWRVFGIRETVLTTGAIRCFLEHLDVVLCDFSRGNEGNLLYWLYLLGAIVSWRQRTCVRTCSRGLAVGLQSNFPEVYEPKAASARDCLVFPKTRRVLRMHKACLDS